jgi:hypothetical protein
MTRRNDGATAIERGRELQHYGTVARRPIVLEMSVCRANEMQVWFVSEHLVDTPLVEAEWAGRGVSAAPGSS